MKASDRLESVWHRCQLRACLGKMAKPGMVAMDIGSGRGSALAILAERVGRTGQVHAFEPDAAQFEALQRRFAADRFPQVRLQSVALLHRQGAKVAPPQLNDHFLPATVRHVRILTARWTARHVGWLYRGISLLRKARQLIKPDQPTPSHIATAEEMASTGGSAETRGTAGTTVDVYAEGALARLDIMCVDVDGLEAHVLLGAFDAIRAHRPVLVFRLRERALRQAGFCSHFVLQWLKALGYDAAPHQRSRWPTSEAVERGAAAEPDWPLLVAFTSNIHRGADRPGTVTGIKKITVAQATNAPSPSSNASVGDVEPASWVARDMGRPPYAETAGPASTSRVLIAYDAGNAFAKYEDRIAKMEQFLALMRMAGFAVEGFPMCLPGSRSWLPWAELDQRWIKRESGLLQMYDELADKLDEYDVLLNSGGTNLHPDFLSELSCVKAAHFADDPEASEIQSRPLAPAYDLVFVANPGCMDMYRGWGVTNAFFLPLGVMRSEFDPAMTENDILTSERALPIVFFASRDPHRDVMVQRLSKAFPEAVVRGEGWPQGTISVDEATGLYKTSCIGWSLDQSVGPVTRRTFIVPANGAMLLACGRTFLSSMFIDGVEAIGFDTIEECLDLTRYYLTHQTERRQIAAAGWRRTMSQYTRDALFKRMLHMIAQYCSRSDSREGDQTKMLIPRPDLGSSPDPESAAAATPSILSAELPVLPSLLPSMEPSQ